MVMFMYVYLDHYVLLMIADVGACLESARVLWRR